MKADEYDNFVCAEIPNPHTHPEEHALVMCNMIHVCDTRSPRQQCRKRQKPCRKCGNENNNIVCCKLIKKCSKGYPKDFCEATTKVDCQYPEYRRRSPKDGGETVIINAGKASE